MSEMVAVCDVKELIAIENYGHSHVAITDYRCCTFISLLHTNRQKL